MKFPESTQQMLWTADQHMAYFNLLPYMVQHMMQVQELNGSLIELIKFFTTKYIEEQKPLVAKQSSLNPLADPFVRNKGAAVDEQQQTKTVDKPVLVVVEYDDEWKTVLKKVKQQRQQKQHILGIKINTRF